jgi:hypothetical protein
LVSGNYEFVNLGNLFNRDGGGVAEDVRRNALPRQRRRFASGCFDVLAQPESEAGSGELFPVAIDEYSLIGAPWMSAE